MRASALCPCIPPFSSSSPSPLVSYFDPSSSIASFPRASCGFERRKCGDGDEDACEPVLFLPALPALSKSRLLQDRPLLTRLLHSRGEGCSERSGVTRKPLLAPHPVVFPKMRLCVHLCACTDRSDCLVLTRASDDREKRSAPLCTRIKYLVVTVKYSTVTCYMSYLGT